MNTNLKKQKKLQIPLIIFLGIILVIILAIVFINFNSKKTTASAAKSTPTTIKKSVSKPSSIKLINVHEAPGEYKPWTTKQTDGKKIAYLTFDDGPSINTESILKILNDNNIKASFFLIGKMLSKTLT